MWPEFIIVPSPALNFPACVVKSPEPVGIWALCPELAIEEFDEDLVGGFARSGEIEDDILLAGP
jgi:hypothetical protein